MKSNQRIVTIGGGKGHARLLRGLVFADASPTAIVGVSDDGGCSGHLRRERLMPPPGDLRLCLTALARDRGIARYYEQRLDISGNRRCIGNLAIADLYDSLGRNLQAASDIFGRVVKSAGRVCPAALDAQTLAAQLDGGPTVIGESAIGRVRTPISSLSLTDSARPNLEALRAIEEASVVILAPGSFVTSLLATLLTGGVGAAIGRSEAEIVWCQNLFGDDEVSSGMDPERQHATIERIIFAHVPPRQITVMSHTDERVLRSTHSLKVARFDLADAQRRHSPHRLSSALRDLLGTQRAA